MMWPRLKAATGRALPRIKSLVWACFATSTAVAYHAKVPTQLVGIEHITPIPLWGLWGLAACLLAAGGLVPRRASPAAVKLARRMRSAGIAICAGLLMMWAITYLFEDGRYWVSGKNYLMLSILATIGAYTIGRDETSPPVVVPGG